jgi:hypothetical protein
MFLHENGCPWDEDTCSSAAINSNINCLKYAHENGCPWNENTCQWAAIFNRLECLKYAHENGCPWNKWTCRDSIYDINLDCLKYAHKNGCPYPKEIKSSIVKKILIPKWRDSVKIRLIVYYWMECSAKTSCGQNGRARIEDMNSFENNFKFIL